MFVPRPKGTVNLSAYVKRSYLKQKMLSFTLNYHLSGMIVRVSRLVSLVVLNLLIRNDNFD